MAGERQQQDEGIELPGGGGQAEEIEFDLGDVQPEPGRGEGRGAQDDRQVGRGRDRNLEQENENLKRALSEARARGRRLRDQMDADRARRDEETRRASAARSGKPSEDAVRKLAEAERLSEAAPTLLELARQQSQGDFLRIRKSIAAISQNNARARYADYDRVLDESGVRQSLSLGRDGRPVDPDTFERILLEADDPGEDAYALALSILEERQGQQGRGGYDTERELPPATGPRTDGRREGFREMEPTHPRPRGIGEAP